ncbi:MAG: DMT family transporter, partial [Oscillospiraceae bacterium]|nr:DMT family transporter [Oscillospiraceae bacterium]
MVTILTYEGGINVVTLLVLRYIITSALLLAFSILRGHFKGTPRRAVTRMILITMLLFAPQVMIYSYAILLLPVATAVLIIYIYPIVISIICVFTGQESISPRRFMMLLVAFGGLALMLTTGFEGGLNPL